MSVAERVVEYTERRKPDECWPWHGWKSDKGYPVVWLDGHYVKVSRLMLGLTDPTIEARHTCDHPWCVNPGHLIPGTHLENMTDMKDRGRGASGERNVNTRLTASQVAEIRADSRGPRALGREYGVSHVTIIRIRRGTQ